MWFVLAVAEDECATLMRGGEDDDERAEHVGASRRVFVRFEE